MLLPRYSLRWFFYLFAVAALLGLVIGQGVRGSQWAIAVACAVASLGVTWIMMIAFYAMARLSAAILLPSGAPRQMEAYYPSPRPPRPPADGAIVARDLDSTGPKTDQEDIA